MAKIQVVHDPSIDAPLQIQNYIHCGKCVDELPPGVSPAEWARLNVGPTAYGIQVWCVRHNCNVDTWKIQDR